MSVWPAWGKRLGSIGLGIALGLGSPSAPRALAQSQPAAAGASSAATPPAGAPKYHRFRAFRIPFEIGEADRARLSKVLLFVSSNGGERWEAKESTEPDKPYFTFRAPRDGEFWFAVRTKDTKGRLFPGDETPIEPSLKVIIDTQPPALTLKPEPRRGARAGVQWEIVEENFDPRSVLVEYQAEGARNWSKVPIKSARIGRAEWDAGTAEPLSVRATVIDHAGNTKVETLELPGGSAARPAASSFNPDEETAPPIGTFTGLERDGLPELPAAVENPAPAPQPRSAQANPAAGGEFDPFRNAGPSEPAPAPGGPEPPLLVNSPRFNLQYAVDDAGPSGRPAAVELWITQNGGQTWFRRGVDPDQVSPFPVDLGGEGSYGLKLVARSASNLGDLPPAPGEAPQTLVEVDSSPPVVKLDPPKVTADGQASKVTIIWHASDPHLGARPVAISVRPDTPGAGWHPIIAMDNSGQYVWTVPPNFPNRFHIRVDVKDTLGNRGYADTAEIGPVLLDRTRPRGRIIGLDPVGRTGSGPSARPLR